jgi:sulfatase maturation enzyme AslB (radical SAM superfamily)
MHTSRFLQISRQVFDGRIERTKDENESGLLVAVLFLSSLALAMALWQWSSLAVGEPFPSSHVMVANNNPPPPTSLGCLHCNCNCNCNYCHHTHDNKNDITCMQIAAKPALTIAVPTRLAPPHCAQMLI